MLDKLKGLFRRASPDEPQAALPDVPVEPEEVPPQPAAASTLTEVLMYAPILDATRQVVAARFSMRPALAGWAVSQPDAYGELMLASMGHSARIGILRARPALVTLPEHCLALPDARALLGPLLIVEALPQGPFDDARRQDWQAVRDAGGRICIDVSGVGDTVPALLQERIPEADLLRVDVSGIPVTQLDALRELIGRHRSRAVCVATGIESEEDRQLCEQLGFRWYSGPYLTQRKIWSERDMPPAAMRVVDILNRLRRDAEVPELAGAIKQDAALPYRLLRYLNSAAAGMRQKITSIDQALVIIGRQKLYRWLLLLMYSTGQATDNASALLEIGLIRARFMEQAVGTNVRAEQRDILFVTGLFSLLDLVLHVPMAKALAAITVHDAVPAALLRQEGPLAPWLDLALACESGEAEELQATAQRCGLSAARVATLHLEAVQWAQALQTEAAAGA